MSDLHAPDPRTPSPLRRGPPAIARDNLAVQARTCLTAASTADDVGDFVLGAEKSHQALAIGQTIADTALQARALSSLALQELRLGNGEAAVIDCHRALALLKRQGDAALRGRALCTLVLSYLCIGLQKDALLYASQALGVAREVNDPALLSWAFNRSGSACKALGEPARAQQLFEEALRFARASGGSDELFAALNNLSGNYLALARTLPESDRGEALAAALEHATEALRQATGPGHLLQQATCHSILARTHIARADHASALVHAELALDIATRRGYRLITMSALLHRGAIERHRGNLKASIEFYNQVLVQARGSDDHDWVKEAHQGLAESHRLSNDASLALEHVEAWRLLERRMLELRADSQVRVLLNRGEIDSAAVISGAALQGTPAPLGDRPGELLQRPVVGTCIAVVAADDIALLRDRHGLAATAEIQRELARLISENARNTDFFAQLDAMSFVVGHAETLPRAAGAVCERLRATIAAYDWSHVAAGLEVTVSIVLCEVSSVHVDPIDRAVAALHAAQQQGRNQVTRLA